MNKLTFIAIAACSLGCFTSCNMKSEDQIKKELEAEYQHKMDSIKLEEAQKQIEELESSKDAVPAAQPVAQAAPAKSASTFSPEFSWLSQRRVTDADLAGLSTWEKSIYRNAIYAMHSRKFVKAEYRNYFSQFSWYRPLYDEVSLSALEQQNIAFIKARE